MTAFFQAQSFILGALLLAAGVVKLVARNVDLEKTGLAELLRTRPRSTDGTVRLAWFALGISELVLGVFLLSGSEPALAGGLGATAMLVSALYIAWILRRRGALSCGCFGTGTLASWRGVARATALALGAVAYAMGAGGRDWRGPLVLSLPVAIILVFELIVLGLLSDELLPWASRLRWLVIGALRALGLRARGSRAIREHVESLPFWAFVEKMSAEEGGSPPKLVDEWRDGSWYLFEYLGRWHSERATIVAGHLLGVRPRWTRFIVAQEDNPGFKVLAHWDSTLPPSDPEWGGS
jgi:hypothetical protein